MFQVTKLDLSKLRRGSRIDIFCVSVFYKGDPLMLTSVDPQEFSQNHGFSIILKNAKHFVNPFKFQCKRLHKKPAK